MECIRWAIFQLSRTALAKDQQTRPIIKAAIEKRKTIQISMAISYS
jgi:hypothetical protein